MLDYFYFLNTFVLFGKTDKLKMEDPRWAQFENMTPCISSRSCLQSKHFGRSIWALRLAKKSPVLNRLIVNYHTRQKIFQTLLKYPQIRIKCWFPFYGISPVGMNGPSCGLTNESTSKTSDLIKNLFIAVKF